MNEKQKLTLKLFITGVIPSLKGSPGDIETVSAGVQRLVNDFDTASAAKIRLFLSVIRLFCLLRLFKSFEKISEQKKYLLFTKLENSFVPKIRSGFYGLRSLALIGCYGSEFSRVKTGFPGPVMKR